MSCEKRFVVKTVSQLTTTFADLPCRYACHNCEWLNVRGNDRSRCDYRSFSYFDPGQDRSTVSNPHPVSDHNIATRVIKFYRLRVMAQRENCCLGTNRYI